MSYLDPHVRLVEIEPTRLALEIEQLKPIIGQLETITKSIDKLDEITRLFHESESDLGEATKQFMAGIGHIEDALHCLKYGPEWTKTGRTCIDSAYLEAV